MEIEDVDLNSNDKKQKTCYPAGFFGAH